MRFVLSSLALASSAAAIPFPSLPGFGPKGKSFSLSVSRRQGFTPDNFLFPVSEGHHHKRCTTGSDNITTSQSYWFASITAGGEPLNVLLDTGSAVFWTLSPNTTAQQNAGQQIYDPSKSSTAVAVANETYAISYGSGVQSITGNVYMDNICVGSACVTAPIGPATNVTGVPIGGVKSGIMGLSFGAASQYTPRKLPTFFEALQNSLSLPLWTANFRADGRGTIDFGFVNSSLYSTPLAPLPINNSTGGWNTPGVTFSAGGKALNSAQPQQMNWDTGSPNLYLYNATIAAYHAQIPNSTYVAGSSLPWQFPCSVKSSLPDLVLTFGDGTTTGRIPGPQVFWGAVSSTMCVSYMIATTTTGLLGDPWFNSQVVVFNQSVPSVAFAPKAF